MLCCGDLDLIFVSIEYKIAIYLVSDGKGLLCLNGYCLF